ncbi:MAG: diguanylate cyclase [Desulfuromonadales bacterium]|nr:diguanylate cyclase [Desulfuromonadales bacterium]
MDRILIVEDDRFFREMYVNLLQAEGYLADTASCGSEAFDLLSRNRYGLVITDLVMPDVSGMEILAQVRECYPGVDVIMVTGNANLESAIFALKHGARDYLTKPVNHDEFLHSVAQCMQQRRLLDENDELKNLLNLFQSSQAIAGCLEMDRVYHLMVEAVAREAGVSRALGLFQGDEGLEIKEAKGISASAAQQYGDNVLGLINTSQPPNRLIVKIQLSNVLPEVGAVAADITEAYLIFMRNNEDLLGVIAVFNEPELSLPDIHPKKKNIRFLLEQSLRAFQNAENYTNAKDMLFIDDLSGLFNYRYLEVALDRELKRVERYASHLAVLFLDLDAFKQINDSHGHLVGSRVLREMADLLKKYTREVDVVIRYGGDEYTIILVETSAETAAIVAERIRSQVESHAFLASEGYAINLTCSIGYACCPEDSMSKQLLLDMADQAMYGGKAEGKNCVVRYTKPS